jgi:predicted DNA-binding transcriptional regulator AlpA
MLTDNPIRPAADRHASQHVWLIIGTRPCCNATMSKPAASAILRDICLSIVVQLGVEIKIGFYMYDIPETGFLRLPQVLSVIPVGKTCWWEGVRAGRFPKPVKLSARCTAWRAEDIQQLIKILSDQAPHS